MFLPPNQRAGGTLEFYNLDYNIAIVSLKKNFSAIRPDDIFIESAQNSSKKVVAIGRDAKFGILMAASGEAKRGNRGCKLDCKDVQVSTCKIKKVLSSISLTVLLYGNQFNHIASTELIRNYKFSSNLGPFSFF